MHMKMQRERKKDVMTNVRACGCRDCEARKGKEQRQAEEGRAINTREQRCKARKYEEREKRERKRRREIIIAVTLMSWKEKEEVEKNGI